MRISDWSSDVCSSDLDKARIDTPTYQVKRELRAFCNDLSDQIGEPIDPGTPVTSIDEFSLFVEENVITLGKLVKAATGIDGRNDQLLEVTPFRSDERRVGKECVNTCRYRW